MGQIGIRGATAGSYLSFGGESMAETIAYADKPWIKSYKLGPSKLKETLEPYPKMPLFKILDDSADRYPSTSAINFLGRIIAYRMSFALISARPQAPHKA